MTPITAWSRRQLLATLAGLATASGLPWRRVSGAQVSGAGAAAVRPYRTVIPQAQLDDLRRRLASTRWPDRGTVDDASQGVQLDRMQTLVKHWRERYDWRKLEAHLNALPQFITAIDGVDIHFLHIPSRHADALPLIMTHGWPGSIVELLKVVGPPTDPTSYGGMADDAFHLVLPWARRCYHQLVYWNEVGQGGHFAAFEQPELFTHEVRSAFSDYRGRSS